MSKLIRHCLALDLVDDQEKIREYVKYHESIWPEIAKTITDAGIDSMEIYRVENRLFMIMEVNESFSFEQKSKADALNPKVQEWEELMWNYQQAIPNSKPGEKWRIMDLIFDHKK